jgi:hypothetical protein
MIAASRAGAAARDEPIQSAHLPVPGFADSGSEGPKTPFQNLPFALDTRFARAEIRMRRKSKRPSPTISAQ